MSWLSKGWGAVKSVGRAVDPTQIKIVGKVSDVAQKIIPVYAFNKAALQFVGGDKKHAAAAFNDGVNATKVGAAIGAAVFASGAKIDGSIANGDIAFDPGVLGKKPPATTEVTDPATPKPIPNQFTWEPPNFTGGGGTTVVQPGGGLDNRSMLLIGGLAAVVIAVFAIGRK